jgi:hypothetical protein
VGNCSVLAQKSTEAAMNDKLDHLLGKLKFLGRRTARRGSCQGKAVQLYCSRREGSLHRKRFPRASSARQETHPLLARRQMVELHHHAPDPFVHHPGGADGFLGERLPVYLLSRLWHPKVRRSDYIILDRQKLRYLNSIERLNCAYCGYANGAIAYVQEIAGRTEQHWCVPSSTPSASRPCTVATGIFGLRRRRTIPQTH